MYFCLVAVRKPLHSRLIQQHMVELTIAVLCPGIFLEILSVVESGGLTVSLEDPIQITFHLIHANGPAVPLPYQDMPQTHCS